MKLCDKDYSNDHIYIVRCLSKITPRLRASPLIDIQCWFILTPEIGAWFEKREQKWTISVLNGLLLSLFSRKKDWMSLTLYSRLIIAECLWSGLNVIYNCESSAYIMQWCHVNTIAFVWYAIFQKRVRVFHRGFQTREKWCLLFSPRFWHRRWNLNSFSFSIIIGLCGQIF